MTLRDWVYGPCAETRGKTAPIAYAAKVLGVSRVTVSSWLNGAVPARTRWDVISARTGRMVPVEEFARVARARLDAMLTPGV